MNATVRFVQEKVSSAAKRSTVAKDCLAAFGSRWRRSVQANIQAAICYGCYMRWHDSYKQDVGQHMPMGSACNLSMRAHAGCSQTVLQKSSL